MPTLKDWILGALGFVIACAIVLPVWWIIMFKILPNL
jgi:hypothetical protein